MRLPLTRGIADRGSRSQNALKHAAAITLLHSARKARRGCQGGIGILWRASLLKAVMLLHAR